MKLNFSYTLLVFFVSTFFLVNLSAQTTPSVNQKVTDYVNSVIGKKVDRGECWDLANQALTFAGAKWDGLYKFGKEVDPKKDEIFPGDIIQFEKVAVEYTKDNTIWQEQYPHHTAIVYKVYGKGDYQIADQNNGKRGKIVGLTDFNIKNVKKGSLKFYRPINK